MDMKSDVLLPCQRLEIDYAHRELQGEVWMTFRTFLTSQKSGTWADNFQVRVVPAFLKYIRTMLSQSTA